MTSTIKELKAFIEDRVDSGNLVDKDKRDHDRALECAWSALDNVKHDQWPDAARYACLAVKIERLYDPEATKWKQLPRMIIDHMEEKLWSM